MTTGPRRRRAGAAASTLSAILMLALTGAASAAHAQDQSNTQQTTNVPGETPRKAADPNAATSVGEVVVTARRRAESARDVPGTVDVVTAGQLAAEGTLAGTGDLLRTIPGVRFNDFSAPNLSEISIRGSGTQRATGADSSVGLFFNGAYVGSSVLGGRNFRDVDRFDLSQIQVLEGPQGALYGRNSEFGAVLITPAQPEFKSSGYVDETYTGGLDQNRLTAVVNQPITDDLAVRVGAESILQSGGFYRNPNGGDYYDHTDGFIIRGQVRYRHGPLDVTFLYDAQDLKLPTFDNAYVLQPGKATAIPLGFTADKFNVAHSGVDGVNQMVQRAMLTANYDLGWVKLTSTSLSSDFHSNQNFAPAISLGQEAIFQSLGETGVYPLGQTSTRAKDNELYEDFHGTGSFLNGRVIWTLGAEAYYSRTSNGQISVTNPCTLTATTGICGGQPGALTCYRLLPTSSNCPAVYPAAFGATQVTPQRYLSVAGYGSTTLDLGWGLSLTGQLRYTTDDKNATQTNFRLYTLTLTAPATANEFASTHTNYDVDLGYKVPFLPASWDTRFYAKTGTGYRAGGINPGISSPVAPVPFQPTYNDEDTTSYELGLKGNVTRHIYYELDGFQSRTTNAIASVNDGCTLLNACKQGPTVFDLNAGTEAVHGEEGKVQARYDVFGGQFNLLLTGSHLDATYVAKRGTSTGLPIIGSPVAQAPDYTASAQLDYAHALTSNLDGFIDVTWNGQWGGVQDLVSIASPRIDLINFDMVSLRTGVNLGKHLQLAFFVQNLTDEVFPVLQLQGLTNIAPVGLPYSLNNRYSQPRTFGANAVYRW